MSGVRWQGEKGGRIARCHGWRTGNVMRCQVRKGGRIVNREGGMEFKNKTALYCPREAYRKQGFTAAI